MDAKNFYTKKSNLRKNIIAAGTFRIMLLFVMLCLSAAAGAQVTFNGGKNQTLSICQSSGTTDINSYLTATDAPFRTETWTLISSTANGVVSGLPQPGFSFFSTTYNTFGVTYTPAAGYSGADSFTVRVSNGLQADTTVIRVTVNAPTISIPSGTGTQICAGSSTSITATGGVSYTWSPATGLSATTGATVIATPASDITYTVTGTDTNGCSNTATFAVTVNPVPAAISGTNNFCIGSIVTLSDATPGGTWSSNDVAIATAGSAGDVSSVSTGTVTIVYTLPTSCSVSLTGTVNALTTIIGFSDQTVCNGLSTAPVNFVASVPGTIINWTNSDPSIGLAGSGTGNIGSFPANNSGFSMVTATINITSTNNGCPGRDTSFVFNVNPTPDVFASNPPQTICAGDSTAPISFFGNVAGTVFSWTNSNSSIGIPGTGVGNIAPFAGIDTSANPITSNITVTSNAAGCSGNSNTFTITVNSKPVLTSGLTPTGICNNALFSYNPTSATPGTTFNWSRNAVPGISNFPNTGVDNPMENLNNTTSLPVAVTYVYMLQSPMGCTDTQNVTVIVNPTVALSSSLTPAAVCDSSVFHYVPTSTPGVTFKWSRAAVPGISNPADTGSNFITEYLVNTTQNPIAVTYNINLSIGVVGCIVTQSVVVTVNPKPVLNTLVSMPRICSGTTFTYVPGSNVTGTTFAWSRAAIAGNPPAHGADTISEVLINNTTASVVVTYIDTLTANGCSNTEAITVRVMPVPVLTSTLTPNGICDSSIFNYTPVSATAGVTYSWVRPFVLGINSIAGSGTGNVSDTLVNNTYYNLNVVYHYTLTDSGCSNSQDVVVVVHPNPVLSSNLSPTVCSGAPFSYSPTSNTFGTTFSWTRLAVANITPATYTGSGSAINETLINALVTPVRVTYDIVLTANGCSHHQALAVTVNPAPPTGKITTHSDSFVCTGTMFQNFGANAPALAGQTYNWTAQNAEVYAMGRGHQYALVTFAHPGTAVVTLNNSLAGSACIGNSSFTVNVSNNVADMPQVVYFEGQFICLQNNMDSYQWGYDDAVTLDSTLLPGEMNPNYFSMASDLAYKNYWVITTHNGCMQKTYYNMPSGITNINNTQADVMVYPNPATEMLHVTIGSPATGSFELEVVNMLGQKLQSVSVTDHKTALDISSLPSGNYMLVCAHDGVKMAAVRFVKN
jgi:hypothetical protein